MQLPAAQDSSAAGSRRAPSHPTPSSSHQVPVPWSEGGGDGEDHWGGSSSPPQLPLHLASAAGEGGCHCQGELGVKDALCTTVTHKLFWQRSFSSTRPVKALPWKTARPPGVGGRPVAPPKWRGGRAGLTNGTRHGLSRPDHACTERGDSPLPCSLPAGRQSKRWGGGRLHPEAHSRAALYPSIGPERKQARKCHPPSSLDTNQERRGKRGMA